MAETNAPPADLAAATTAAHEAVFRIEQARQIASLCCILRQIFRQADIAHDATVTAIAELPKSGSSNDPGGWLMADAKRARWDRLLNARDYAALERVVRHYRLPSPPATRGHVPWRRRTGRRSPRSMTPSARSCPRQWSN